MEEGCQGGKQTTEQALAPPDQPVYERLVMFQTKSFGLFFGFGRSLPFHVENLILLKISGRAEMSELK